MQPICEKESCACAGGPPSRIENDACRRGLDIPAAKVLPMEQECEMNLFLVVFLGVCVATAIWSVFLVRRAQDWRGRFLTLAVGVMPLYQAIGVLKEKGIWSPGTTNQVDALVELVIAA